MLRTTLLLSSLFMLPMFSIAQLQDVPVSITDFSAAALDAKGLHSIDQLDILNVEFGTTKLDGNKAGTFNGQDIRIRYGSNVINGLMVRGAGTFTRFATTPEGIGAVEIPSAWLAQVEVLKSVPIGNTNIYPLGSVAVGRSYFKNEFEGATSKVNNGQFNWAAGVEYRQPLTDDGIVFSPSARYFSEREKYEDGTSIFSGFQLNGRMDAFFGCGDFDPCGQGPNGNYGNDPFHQGQFMTYGETGFNFNIGSQKDRSEFDGQTFESTIGRSEIDVRLAGSYYAIDGIAPIVDIAYSREGSSNDDTNTSSSESHWSVSLGALAHMPTSLWRPLYGKFKVGLGSIGNSNSSDLVDNSSSESLVKYQVGIGTYHFVLPSLAFNTQLYYEGESFGDPKQAESAFYLGVGMASFFN